MSTRVFHRRRAERFAQLLDEAEGGRRHHVRSRDDDDLAPFTRLAARLRVETTVAVAGADLATCRGAVLEPEFRTGLRAMLVATAVRDGIGVTAEAPEAEPEPRTFGKRRRAAATATTTTVARRSARTRAAVIIGVAAGTLALSGMSAASGDAMPGDALYGVKRSTERAQLALASSDESRGKLYLDFARTRVAEARAVQLDAVGLIGVLGDMDSDTHQGVLLLTRASVQRRDPATLEWVDTFVTDQMQKLSDLQRLVTGVGHERVLESKNVLTKVEVRSRGLRTALGCPTVASGEDELGPKPNACVPVPKSNITQSGTGQGAGAQPRTGNGGPAVPDPSAPTSEQQPAEEPTGGEPDDGFVGDLGRLLGGLLGP